MKEDKKKKQVDKEQLKKLKDQKDKAMKEQKTVFKNG